MTSRPRGALHRLNVSARLHRVQVFVVSCGDATFYALGQSCKFQYEIQEYVSFKACVQRYEISTKQAKKWVSQIHRNRDADQLDLGQVLARLNASSAASEPPEWKTSQRPSAAVAARIAGCVPSP